MPARSDPTHPCSPEWLPSLPFALQAAVVPKVIIPVAKAMLPIQLVQVGRGPIWISRLATCCSAFSSLPQAVPVAQRAVTSASASAAAAAQQAAAAAASAASAAGMAGAPASAAATAAAAASAAAGIPMIMPFQSASAAAVASAAAAGGRR